MKSGTVLKLGLSALAAVVLLSGATCSSSGKSATAKAGGQDIEKESYGLGYQFGRNIASQPVQLDVEAIIAGLRQAMAGKSPKYDEKEIQVAVETLKEKIKTAQEAKLREQSAKAEKDGAAFLAENGKKPGVVTLPSGLQYKIIKEGQGQLPGATARVSVHYRGTLVDGTEFDSSYSRGQPAQLGVGEVIPGWQEALKLMKTGSKWQIVVPPSLAYGDRPIGRIPPNSTLLFDIELLSIVDAIKPPAK
jgi:FKBP-type peptidyl-prolyl cis-trans isomerase FklB